MAAGAEKWRRAAGAYIPRCFAGWGDASLHALLWREKQVAEEGVAWLLRAGEGALRLGEQVPGVELSLGENKGLVEGLLGAELNV